LAQKGSVGGQDQDSGEETEAEKLNFFSILQNKELYYTP